MASGRLPAQVEPYQCSFHEGPPGSASCFTANTHSSDVNPWEATPSRGMPCTVARSAATPLWYTLPCLWEGRFAEKTDAGVMFLQCQEQICDSQCQRDNARAASAARWSVSIPWGSRLRTARPCANGVLTASAVVALPCVRI